MDLRCYLAMTCAEFQAADILPPHIAWMACHFSSYGTGLSNVPTDMPPGSMLIVNDRIPVYKHDPQRILKQLYQCIEQFTISGVLLDFQRPNCPDTAHITQLLTSQLSCPIAVTAPYAADLSCAVFLPPPPLHVPLSSHIAPWSGREIWLEIAVENQCFSVTPAGSSYTLQPFQPLKDPCFSHNALHCKYQIEVNRNHAVFTLSRDPEMLGQLLKEADSLGIRIGFGLYQQLQDIPQTETANLSCQQPSNCL